MYLTSVFKIYTLIILLNFAVSEQVLGITMNASSKYKYQVSESAPNNYPMQIIKGALLFHDGSGTLFIPNMVIVAKGWGEGRSSHVLENNNYPLPNKLQLIFFSFTENQFYQGEFDLPYEKINKLFSDGYYSHRAEEIVTYDSFIVGTAPGGFVSVWLNSFDRQIEVFYGQATKFEGDWKWVVDNPDVSRNDFINEAIEYEQRTPEAKEDYKNNGVPFGLWSKYHSARYFWTPTLKDMNLRDNIIDHVMFYNGEEIYKGIQIPGKVKETLAVPREMHIMWNRTGYLVNDLKIECFFDEKEIFNAFESIAKDNLPINMEFRMEPEKNYDFTIWLRTEKNSIELKKTKIKTWKPGGMRYENAGPEDTK